MSLIFVDVEAYGNSPATGRMTELGCVSYPDMQTFHGDWRDPEYKGIVSDIPEAVYLNMSRAILGHLEEWLTKQGAGRPIFVSDNPAFDWQWVNCLYWKTLNRNPFGHSARRIGDFAAGLVGDFRKSSEWKRLRITPHDHNPVNDARGNAEAFARLGER